MFIFTLFCCRTSFKVYIETPVQNILHVNDPGATASFITPTKQQIDMFTLVPTDNQNLTVCVSYLVQVSKCFMFREHLCVSLSQCFHFSFVSL